MEKLTVKLKNCYGIRDLEHEFHFDQGNTHVIYAPNGSMKTSFAKVLQDLSHNREPSDRIFTQREATWTVVDQDSNSLKPDSIFVVESYEQSFRSEKMTTLLANTNLKRDFEEAHASVDAALSTLHRPLSKSAGFTKEVWETLCEDYGVDRNDVCSAVKAAYDEIQLSGIRDVADIRYKDVINEKTLDFLNSPGLRKHLDEYIAKYDELLERSRFFRKGSFTHYGAASVAKALRENKFFEADHSIRLADREGPATEVADSDEFETQIKEERDRILEDPELHARFENVDSQLNSRKELRALRDMIAGRPELLKELSDLSTFRRRLWQAYIGNARDEASGYLKTYAQARARIDEIIKAASGEVTQWDKVVAEFNRRFDVPFRLRVENQNDVILRDTAPSIVFSYTDGIETAEVGDSSLIEILSMGERRALYLLNILFEIRAREHTGTTSLLVFDDIADSFDYKNKYAIVEYLRDIQQNQNFRLVILTHNYDFYRTVRSRLGIEKTAAECERSGDKLTLQKPKFRNPLGHWKNQMSRDRRCFLAAVPMVRNLVEYTKSTDCDEYAALTRVLHIKDGSDSVTLSELASLYAKIMNVKVTADETGAIAAILEQAERIAQGDDGTALENKVILAMATRLRAEKYIFDELRTSPKTEEFKRNQTAELVDRFKQTYPERTDVLAVLDRVLLMTPESIHLNSFVYEPLVDMSDTNLRQVYSEVKHLEEESAWRSARSLTT